MKRLIKANELGELIYEYKNGMKEYVVKNVNVPKSENNMFLAMESVIKNDFIEFFNNNYYEIKRSDYDYNANNGMFTVYTNEDPSLNNFTKPTKLFFQTIEKADLHNYVEIDGTIDQSYSNYKFEFEYIGDKF